MDFTQEETQYLKAAIKNGATFTTAIRPIGPLGSQAIKMVKPENPFGHQKQKGVLAGFFGRLFC